MSRCSAAAIRVVSAFQKSTSNAFIEQTRDRNRLSFDGWFFQSVRVKTLLVLYANPIAWAHFGYEGEAFSKGGYLLRGFNDLKWLPDVPAADSGPMPSA